MSDFGADECSPTFVACHLAPHGNSSLLPNLGTKAEVKRSARWLTCVLLLALGTRSMALGQGVFRRGDCDESGRFNITDPVKLLGYLFLGGQKPICIDACDVDDNGALQITDAISALSYLFLGGSEPRPPFEREDVDPTNDLLGCANGRDPPAQLLVQPLEVFFHRSGNTVVLEVVAVDSSGLREDVRTSPSTTYSVDNPAIVEVNEDGLITARGVGQSRVRVRYRGVFREAFVRVLDGANGAPLIRITAPANGSVVTSDTVAVSGHVTDAQASVSAAGLPVTSVGGFFTGRVPLSLGLNTIVVKATGTAGSSEKAVTILRAAIGSAQAFGPDAKPLPEVAAPFSTLPDVTAPSIAITSPSSGASLISSMVQVRGTVNDPAADVFVNGAQASVHKGLFEVTLRLDPGPLTLVAEAFDPVGNRGQAALPVTIDSIVPRVSIRNPLGVLAGSGASTPVTVGGLIEPPGAPVVVNGVVAQVTGDAWSASLTLGPGMQELVATTLLPGPAARRAQAVAPLFIDTEGPLVELTYPPERQLLSSVGYRTESSVTHFVGRVGDFGMPRELEGKITLSIGGVLATVVNGTFLADLPLEPGSHAVQLVAQDARGNVTSRNYRVVRGGAAATSLAIDSGDGLTLVAGQEASVQLIAMARDAANLPQRSVVLEFRVTLGDGLVDGLRSRSRLTGVDGRAAVSFRPGGGAGFSVVEVSGLAQANSPVAFVLPVNPGTGRVLVAHRVRSFTGTAGADLPTPLEVRLIDDFGTPMVGEPVRFRVVKGGALFAGEVERAVVTSAAGVASVATRLPPGVDSLSTIAASHSQSPEIMFEARGLAPGPAADTEVLGSVLNSRGQPMPGIDVQLRTSSGTLPGLTDSFGGYRIAGVPAGDLLLMPVAVGFRTHEVRSFAVSGRANHVDAIRMAPATDPSGVKTRSQLLSETQGALMTLKGLPGLRLQIAPGSVTFPGGSKSGTLTLASLALSTLPAMFPDDLHADVPIAILPEGVRFDPPASLSVPRVRERAGCSVPMFVHSAAAGEYVESSLGVVGEEAGSITASGGRGLRTGGVVFLSRPGPLAGRTGTLSGRVIVQEPGFQEVPQRAESVSLGFNVLAHSGEFFVEETDLELPLPGRGLPYAFRRRYESRHNFKGSLGWNWEHEYEDRRLHPSLNGGSIVRANGKGSFDEFLLDSVDGQFVSPVGVFARLFVDAQGFYIEREPDGTIYRYHPLDGTPRGGRLESITDRSQNHLFLVRGADGLISQAIDPLGRGVDYEHDSEGRIMLIRDASGREVVFEYSSAGDLVAARSPVVVSTPTDNAFPAGRRREYVYSTGNADDRLNHNLLEIIDPREVAATRLPRIHVVYGMDPTQPSFDRVVRQDWGGTNASGVPAGGTVGFEYAIWRTAPDSYRSGSDLESFLLSAAGTTRFTDQEGRVRDVVWSGAGLPISLRVRTVPQGRPRDPANLHPPPGTLPPFYETRWTWTREGCLASRTEPRGDRKVYTRDEGSPLRYAQASLIRVEHHPAPTVAGPGKPAVTSYLRDPLFGVVVEEVSPRGNDPEFMPPTGGAGGPGRYRRRWTLDYQEGSTLAALASEAAVDADDLAEALARSGITLALGDLNGDGETSQRSGNVIREALPPAIPPGGGPAVEYVISYQYNRLGQLILTRDGAGRTTRLEYHPETDWNGDGTPETGPGRDTLTGGLLARRIADQGSAGAPREVVVEQLTYDASGYLASRRDANGNDEFHVYNPLGELMERRLAPPLKYRSQWIYDADGNVTRTRIENYTSTDGGGHFLVTANQFLDTDTEFDLLGRPVTVTREVSGGEVGPERSIITRYRYSPTGLLARVIQPVIGTDETWLRDERGLVIEHRTAVETPQEAVVRSFHDEGGNLLRIEGDLAEGAKEHRYDGFGREIGVIDAAGGMRVLDRDIEGNITVESFLGSAGGPTPVDGSGHGNVLLSRACHAHDEQGRSIESVHFRFAPGAGPGASATALRERRFFDAGGLLVRRIDLEGNEWKREYDSAGRLAHELDPFGGSRSYLRDANGNAVREVRESLTLDPVDPGVGDDPDYGTLGRYREVETILRTFDPLNRLTMLVDSGGGVWRARYDAMSRVLLVADAKGISVGEDEPEFASLRPYMTERQRTNLNGFGNRTRYVYDNLGRLVESQSELRTDGEGSQLIDITSPYNRDGIITEKFEWDDLSRLIAWVDDNEHRTSVELDAWGRVTRKIWPEGVVETRRRTADGRGVEITDANGSVVSQEFDVLGRLIQRLLLRGAGVEGTTVQRFEYDGLSRLTLAFDNNSPEDPLDDAVTILRRDSLGDTQEESQDGFTFTIGRDLAARQVSIQYPDGSVFATPRDRTGRVTALSDSTGTYATYRHFGTGRLLEKRLANGVTLSFLREVDGVQRNVAFDVFGQPIEHVYRNAAGEAFHGFEYGRDRNGFKLYEKPIHRADELGEVWRYDSIYRLQRFLPNVFEPRVPPIDPLEKIVFYTDGSHSWRLLEINFSVRKLQVDSRNSYIRSDEDVLTYDARGSLKTKGQFSYAYDALGRLVRIVRGASTVAVHGYDAFGAEDPENYSLKGRRLLKDVKIPARDQPPGLIRFTYVGNRVAEERDSQSQLLRQYLYVDDRSPEVLRLRGASAPARSFSFLQDAARSPTALLDDSAVVLESYRYDPFGLPRVLNSFGSLINFSNLGVSMGFGGNYHDFESSLHSSGARHFDPAFGRFIADAGALVPASPLELNGYQFPGLDGLPGEVTGDSSGARRADYLNPFKVTVHGRGGEAR